MNTADAYFAKERLLAALDSQIAELEMSAKVCDQMNRMAAEESREKLARMNRLTARRIEIAVEQAEQPSQFGQQRVSPMNYPYFAKAAH